MYLKGIKTNKLIKTTRTSKLRYFTEFCIVYMYKYYYSALTVSVFKKLGKANVRNKIRRRIKAIFQFLHVDNCCVFIRVTKLGNFNDYANCLQSIFKNIKN